ncbi:MAG TPA: RidA family protein [Lysobacter sp.]|nr:RidA family protein [Lysobacter sp.]
MHSLRTSGSALALLLAGCASIGEPAPWALERSNPGPLPPPAAGTFSRVVRVPAGSEFVYFTGQTGTRPDGTTPAAIEEQVELALENVAALLAAHGMDASHVVKVTFYQTDRATDRERMRAAWTRMFGATPPATTLLFVQGLARPEYKFEIDVVAARPAR